MIKLNFIENSNDIDLIHGIDILLKYIPHNLCIDSNELIYWLDNYNINFTDNLYCYVIKQNNIVIGWLQFTHFINKFIFLDYLIVEEEYRTTKIMKEIYKQLTTIIKQIKCDTIILECGYEMNQHDAIVRLYEIFGFKQFEFNYKEPKLDVDLKNKILSWEELPSTLMYQNLNNEEVDGFDIVHTIYFNHYLRWYSLYEIDMTNYEQFMGLLFQMMFLNNFCGIIN
jgi:hypothetical protein